MMHDELVEFPEFRSFIVGLVERFGQSPVICYDYEGIIAYLASEMEGEDPYTDAVEYFNFNVLGAYIGEYTPAFLTADCELVAELRRGGPGADVADPDSGALPGDDARADSEPAAP